MLSNSPKCDPRDKYAVDCAQTIPCRDLNILFLYHTQLVSLISNFKPAKLIKLLPIFGKYV